MPSLASDGYMMGGVTVTIHCQDCGNSKTFEGEVLRSLDDPTTGDVLTGPLCGCDHAKKHYQRLERALGEIGLYEVEGGLSSIEVRLTLHPRV